MARSNAAVARQAVTDTTPSAAPAPTLGLDQLLDKISAHGLSSLTPEERRLLDEAARRQAVMRARDAGHAAGHHREDLRWGEAGEIG